MTSIANNDLTEVVDGADVSSDVSRRECPDGLGGVEVVGEAVPGDVSQEVLAKRSAKNDVVLTVIDQDYCEATINHLHLTMDFDERSNSPL